jgi:hypothetical protein
MQFFFELDMNGNLATNQNYNPNAPISATNEKYVWKQGKQLDEGEALVFWLSLTTSDPRQPFTGSPKKVYYDFAADRLIDGSGNDVDPDPMDTSWNDPDYAAYPSYKPDHAGDSCYVLIDSRAYAIHVDSAVDIPAVAEDGDFGATRTYVAQVSASGAPTYVNPSKFQIICAGQDGAFDDNSPPGGMFVNTAPDYGFKLYPAGMNYTDSDKDNLTNFSEGQTLVNAIP